MKMQKYAESMQLCDITNVTELLQEPLSEVLGSVYPQTHTDTDTDTQMRIHSSTLIDIFLVLTG